MPIRYHLDESVNHAVALGLRRRGVDVSTATDAGLLGADDETQLSFARANGRVAVTHDDDFLRLAASGVHHGGIAYCHQRNRTIGQIIHALVRLWRTESAEDMQQQVIYL